MKRLKQEVKEQLALLNGNQCGFQPYSWVQKHVGGVSILLSMGTAGTVPHPVRNFEANQCPVQNHHGEGNW